MVWKEKQSEIFDEPYQFQYSQLSRVVWKMVILPIIYAYEHVSVLSVESSGLEDAAWFATIFLASKFQYSQLSRVVWKFVCLKPLCVRTAFQYSQLSRVVWKSSSTVSFPNVSLFQYSQLSRVVWKK